MLSACGEQVARSEGDYFIPPTLAHQASPIPLETATSIPPSPTPTCENNLTFLEDITIPDGTAFAPGAAMEKVWLVQNSGSCNWDASYRLRNIYGESLGAQGELALFPARSGSEAEIRIVFTAPTDSGAHTSSWQAHTANGVPFGEAIFIMIEVDRDLENQPLITPTPRVD